MSVLIFTCITLLDSTCCFQRQISLTAWINLKHDPVFHIHKSFAWKRYKPNVELLGMNDTELCFKKSRAKVYECAIVSHCF